MSTETQKKSDDVWICPLPFRKIFFYSIFSDFSDMSVVVPHHSPSSSHISAISCSSQPEQTHICNIGILLYLTMIAIILNGIYSMMIYKELKRLKRTVERAETNVITSDRMLYGTTSALKESLLRFINLINTQKTNIEHYGQ